MQEVSPAKQNKVPSNLKYSAISIIQTSFKHWCVQTTKSLSYWIKKKLEFFNTIIYSQIYMQSLYINNNHTPWAFDYTQGYIFHHWEGQVH
jgi:hypothetical protein